MKIAYQGIEGSYSENCAKKLYPELGFNIKMRLYNIADSLMKDAYFSYKQEEMYTVLNSMKKITQLQPQLRTELDPYIIKLEKQKTVTEKLLDEFNLQHLRSLNASVLSGGEVRRVMLARLMINKPKIVLLDEPLAALDPQIIQDIQKYILKIQSSGTAVLITDHNVRNLFDITDRSYVISEGNVIAEGTSRELLKSSKAIEHYFGSQFS